MAGEVGWCHHIKKQQQQKTFDSTINGKTMKVAEPGEWCGQNQFSQVWIWWYQIRRWDRQGGRVCRRLIVDLCYFWASSILTPIRVGEVSPPSPMVRISPATKRPWGPKFSYPDLLAVGVRVIQDVTSWTPHSKLWLQRILHKVTGTVRYHSWQ